MDTCQRCESERLADIQAHHNDLFFLSIESDNINVEADYAPNIEGICNGDDTQFCFCMDCGQIQGEFPKHVEE